MRIKAPTQPQNSDITAGYIITDVERLRKPMQQISDTHQYLSGKKHDLRDHFVCVSTDELIDPSCNICGGVRWLFRKRETASWLLKRRATWEETIEDYKAILSKRINKDPYNPKPMEDFREYYEILKQE